MVIQYPDIMVWTVEEVGDVQFDEYGYPIPFVGQAYESICRYENWKGAVTQYRNRNGESVFQKGTIFVQFGEDLPIVGEIVTVLNDRFKGEVLNVYRGQLNYTIAV